MNLIKYMCDGVIESIDNRVRTICEKYESRLHAFRTADIAGCTLIIAGITVESSHLTSRPGHEPYRSLLEPQSSQVALSTVIAMRFELPPGGSRHKTIMPDANFRPQYWVLIGPENCWVANLKLSNIPVSVGESAGHFGQLSGPTLHPQHKITAEVRRGS